MQQQPGIQQQHLSSNQRAAGQLQLRCSNACPDFFK
jgi:hypothetical protein